MRRRDLIAASALLPAVAVADRALASEDAPASAPALGIPGVGLPVIAGGRIRNYVFVTLRLHLGGHATPETMRGKEAFFRDAIVRAAHRTPFTVANDWTRLDATAISASLMRSAVAIAGRGSITRVEVVNQSPRRRTGVRSA
ncbi:MAG: hypothetical protein EON89_08075 [Brevundimonas sp.]|nr:MAG: hypothetical protein EON89_08075 [Brevundimonas sp.]